MDIQAAAKRWGCHAATIYRWRNLAAQGNPAMAHRLAALTAGLRGDSKPLTAVWDLGCNEPSARAAGYSARMVYHWQVGSQQQQQRLADLISHYLKEAHHGQR